jgi:hypothetical protein
MFRIKMTIIICLILSSYKETAVFAAIILDNYLMPAYSFPLCMTASVV